MSLNTPRILFSSKWTQQETSVPIGEYDGDLVGTGILPEFDQDLDTLVEPDFLKEGPNGPDTNMDSNVQNSEKIAEVSTHQDGPDTGTENAVKVQPNSDTLVELDFLKEGPNGPDTNIYSNVQNSEEITEVSTHQHGPDNRDRECCKH